MKNKSLKVILIFLFLAVYIFVMSISVVFYMGQNPESSLGKKTLFLSNDSMEPEIKAYAICLVEEVTPEVRTTLAKGDIVTYGMYIDDTKYEVVGKIDERITGRVKIAAEEGGLPSYVKTTKIERRIVKSYGFTAPVVRILSASAGWLLPIGFSLVLLSYFAYGLISHYKDKFERKKNEKSHVTRGEEE